MYDIWYCLNASILTYILEKFDAQYMYVTILPACYRKRLMFCLKGLEKTIIAIVAHVSDVAHESLVK